MGVSNLTTVQSICKEVLLPEIREQLNMEMLFRQLMQRSSKNVRMVGRSFQVNMAMRTAASQGIGARAVGGALPTAIPSAFATTTVTLTNNYAQLKIAGQNLIYKGDPSSLVNILDDEMASAVDTLHKDEMRQMMGDGSGALCTITTTGATGTSFVVSSAQYLEPGMVVDSYTAKTGGSQNINSCAISAVDVNTNTVTIASCTWGTNDYLFREDNRGLEAMGLLGIVDDGSVVASLQGVTRSTSPYFKANLVSAGGEALSVNWLLKTFNTVYKNGGKEPNVIVSDLDAMRYYTVILQPTVRHVNTLKLKGGQQGLEFQGGNKPIGWFADRYCWAGYIYFLHTPNFCIFEPKQEDWIDSDGAVLARVTGYDQFEATLAHYWNLGVDRCNTQGVLYNYADPTS